MKIKRTVTALFLAATMVLSTPFVAAEEKPEALQDDRQTEVTETAEAPTEASRVGESGETGGTAAEETETAQEPAEEEQKPAQQPENSEASEAEKNSDEVSQNDEQTEADKTAEEESKPSEDKEPNEATEVAEETIKTENDEAEKVEEKAENAEAKADKPTENESAETDKAEIESETDLNDDGRGEDEKIAEKVFDSVETVISDDEENCHTMTKKWFYDKKSVNLFEDTDPSVLKTIEEYFDFRLKSVCETRGKETELISDDVAGIEEARRKGLNKFWKKLNIKVTDADHNVRIDKVEESDGNVTAYVYEWIFYDYEDLDADGVTMDVAGFGVEHILCLELVDGEYIVAEDLYDESERSGVCTTEEKEYPDEPEMITSDKEGGYDDSASLFTSNYYYDYDVSAAIAYADKYAINYNPSYYNFNSIGGDCANFVSQCINAGGMPQVVGSAYGTDCWYYKTSNNRSATWTGAHQLRNWMANKRGLLISSPSNDQLYAGSPFFTNSGGHALICVGYNSAGSALYSAHNSDAYREKVYISSVNYTVQLTPSNYLNNKYGVIYHANGGTGEPSSQTKYYGQDITLSTVKPTRTGYTFKKWNTSSDGSGITYAPGATYSENAPLHLYAQWEAISYTITYNANGGTGAPSSQTKIYDQKVTLSSLKPTRTGYDFVCWNTKSNGSGTNWYPGDTYGYYEGNLYLYAKWKAKTYTITYNANGGTGAPASQTKTHGKSINLRSSTPTREGYDFVCWYTNSNGSGVRWDPNENYSIDEDLYLYAQWEPKTYTITYNANGGTGAPSSQTKTYDQTIYLSNSVPARTGYDFVCWNNIISDGVWVEWYPGDSFSANCDLNLYAQWEAKTYKIIYDTNGGTGTPASQTKTYDQDIYLSNSVPIRTGYEFVRWNTKADGNGVNWYPGESYSANDDLYLYAQWDKVYTITYDANGGTGAPEAQEKMPWYYHVRLRSTVPTRTGYIFICWNTKADGSGVRWDPDEAYDKETDLHLYAQWGAFVDITGDGKTDRADAEMVLKHDSGLVTLTGSRFSAADVNSDGKVDFNDAVLMLKYLEEH